MKKGEAGGIATKAAADARAVEIMARLAGGLTLSDLAAELGVTYGSARTIAYRARKRTGIPARSKTTNEETQP